MNDIKWDRHFLDMARLAASMSKDPSTQVGAVAVRDRRVLATGYNGFAAGVADTPERLADRVEKLARTVHAEANCVATAARHGAGLAGCTLYVWPLPPCCGCASILVNAGVREVVVPAAEVPERWVKSVDMAWDVFAEAGVSVRAVGMPGGIVKEGAA